MRPWDNMFLKPLRVTLAAVLAVGGFAALPAASQANPDANSGQGVRQAELIIEARPGASVDEINARNRTTTLQRLNGTNFYRLGIPAKKSERKWQKMIARDPDVISAALNPVISSPLSVF